jgi:hypothetical protein
MSPGMRARDENEACGVDVSMREEGECRDLRAPKPQAADHNWASCNVARANCIAHFSAAQRRKDMWHETRSRGGDGSGRWRWCRGSAWLAAKEAQEVTGRGPERNPWEQKPRTEQSYLHLRLTITRWRCSPPRARFSFPHKLVCPLASLPSGHASQATLP